jgi:glycosyltransferase involved in cell wall biosynthesis
VFECFTWALPLTCYFKSVTNSSQPLRISVVTVAYNSAKTIRQTIESVLAQSHPSIEYLVIDGGSQDGTLDITHEYQSRIDVMVSEPDKGIYDAMNKGLRLSSGDVVGFLNSDDCFTDSESLQKVALHFKEDVQAVYGDMSYMTQQGLTHRRFWRSSPYKAGLSLTGWAPAHPTLYVRRDVLISCGGFRSDYRYSADFELALRLFEVSRIKTCYVPSEITRMRLGGATSGKISDIWKANWEAARACRENGYAGGLWFVLRKLMHKLPQLFLSRAMSVTQAGDGASVVTKNKS